MRHNMALCALPSHYFWRARSELPLHLQGKTGIPSVFIECASYFTGEMGYLSTITDVCLLYTSIYTSTCTREQHCTEHVTVHAEHE